MGGGVYWNNSFLDITDAFAIELKLQVFCMLKVHGKYENSKSKTKVFIHMIQFIK